MRIHWHRRDLRIPDNRGLSTPDESAPVVPVFVLDDDVLAHASPPRVAFLLDALRSLRTDYREAGSDLLVRHGNPDAVLLDLVDAVGAELVTACADYSGLARRRDDRVSAALRDADVAIEFVEDAVLVSPGTITTTAGDPYKVFSYYGDTWHERDKRDPVSDQPVLASPGESLSPGSIPDLADCCCASPTATVPPAGTAEARDRLRQFCDGPIYAYADRRDYPAAAATSRLSPHLSFGTIGVREVHAATERAHAEAPGADARASVREFQEQLAWRDFYTEQLSNHPSMVAANLDPFPESLDWANDEAAFDAWTQGQTGYPIVDAGMRQLQREAWMHNRVRMIVASFLTKDLRIDWRWGYAWFREKLVDHDPANDAGGWQWAASTGTDAQPFFRIFNPATQAADYDPDGEYVREYVPELRDASTDRIHDWPALEESVRRRVAPDYPAPIVDHAEARESALEMYRTARGE